MAIRLSGMSSGLDTDSIVSALVSSYSTKKDNLVKKQTKLSWTQDSWKSMNTKIYSFYTSKLSGMRLSSSYNKKTASISNSSVAKVTASSNAVNGTQELKVKKLATSGYLTGGEISGEDGAKLTGSSKLSEVDGLADYAGGTIEVKTGSKTTKINLTADTTLNNLVVKLKDAGVNASYDATNNRFFISSTSSGKDADFSLTASDENGTNALKALGLFSTSDAELARYKTDAELDVDAKTQEAYENQKTAYTDTETQQKTLEAQLETLTANQTAQQTNKEYLAAKANYLKMDYNITQEDVLDENGALTYDEDGNKITRDVVNFASDTTLEDKRAEITQEIDRLNANLEGYQMRLQNGEELSEDELTQKASLENQLKAAKDADAILGNDVYVASDFKTQEESVTKQLETATTSLAETNQKLDETKDALSTPEKLEAYTAERNQEIDEKNAQLEASLRNYYSNLKDTAQKVLDGAYAADTTDKDKNPVRIVGDDSEIELNGATFKNSTNTFSINGLTIQATAVTGDESVTITTDTDVDGIYDMIKDFFSSYNELITSMDTAYNASSSSGYEPLTDDEKESMTDSEIEKWETKIKDSLLRRDSTLGNLSSMMKTVMASAYTVNGKNYSLSSFGINTLGYFASDTNERGTYHIDGDSDDDSTSGNTDKLRAAIASDPDTVVTFLSKLSTELYTQLTNKMATSSLSSAYTVYNDKQMTSQYSQYTSDISDWEDKIADYEERYYSKFSAMETALSKLNSQTSSLSGLFG
jgi:flagellar hook-associated protein 2